MNPALITLILPSPSPSQRHSLKTLFPEWLYLDIEQALVFCAIENPTNEDRIFYDIEQYISSHIEDLSDDEEISARVEQFFNNDRWREECRDMLSSFYRLYVTFLASIFGRTKWEIDETIECFSFSKIIIRFKLDPDAQFSLF